MSRPANLCNPEGAVGLVYHSRCRRGSCPESAGFSSIHQRPPPLLASFSQQSCVFTRPPFPSLPFPSPCFVTLACPTADSLPLAARCTLLLILDLTLFDRPLLLPKPAHTFTLHVLRASIRRTIPKKLKSIPYQLAISDLRPHDLGLHCTVRPALRHCRRNLPLPVPQGPVGLPSPCCINRAHALRWEPPDNCHQPFSHASHTTATLESATKSPVLLHHANALLLPLTAQAVPQFTRDLPPRTAPYRRSHPISDLPQKDPRPLYRLHLASLS
ncbi:hypothetical protein PMIN03_003808 [Paraphaeosphaeria minitans]